MSTAQLLAEILRLPSEERRGLLERAAGSLSENDPDMTPELAVELERRYQHAIDHPEESMTWAEACAYLDKRKLERKKATA